MTIWSIIPLITALAYLGLLAVVVPSSHNKANRIFAVFLTFAALWSFTSFVLHIDPFPGRTLFINELLAVFLALTLVAYYHFIRAYAHRPAGFGVYLGYGLVVVLAFFAFSGKVIDSAIVNHGVLTNHYALGGYLLGAFSVAFVAPVVFLLVTSYKASRNPTDRNRTMYMIAGWSIMVVLTYTNYIPAASALPLDHAGSLINAMVTTYAISQLKLLDIRFVMRRGIALTIIAIVLIGISVGLLFLGQTLFPTERTYALLIIAPILVFAFAVTARPLSRVAQIGVDRLFYGDTYSYRQSLLAFSSRVGSIIDLDQLSNEMLPWVMKALRIDKAGLMFQQNGGNFVTKYLFPPSGTGDGLEFSLDSPLVALLEKENEPISVKQMDSLPQLKGLWEPDRDRLANSGLEFLCPLKSRGRLIGILKLGTKKQNGLYLSEDLELIRSLSSQAGIIVDNARMYSQAVTWANTDGLTEIYNHRHFHERIDQEIARGTRFGSVFSLVILDLDHFKTFNDNYGHLAGDEVLRRVGNCIQTSIRSIDMAFRYGGEEFAVILPGTRLSDAYKVAERIRNTIEAKGSSGFMPVTASLGISSWPVDGVGKQEIIGRADSALYQAKQSGRNKVCLSSEVVKGSTSLIGTELLTKERAVSIIYALAATVDAKDHYTYGHSKKVSQYAVTLGEALGLSGDRVGTIRAAGLLHDIGKIAVPDSILNKTGPLTPEEWEPIKAHPELGMEILKHVIDLVNCLPGILHHHEHFDGSGYPGALKGDEIPLEARILAIADVYDAITSLRPYRTQLSPQEAIAELRRCAGTQFDPELVTVFCKSIETITIRHSFEQPNLTAPE